MSPTGETSLYVDGTFQDVAGAFDLSTNLHDIVFGAAGSCGHYAGLLDDVAIWSRARTPSEIAADAQGRALYGGEANLIGYWDFDDDAGQAVLDQSPAWRDAVLGSTTAAEASDPSRTLDTPF